MPEKMERGSFLKRAGAVGAAATLGPLLGAGDALGSALSKAGALVEDGGTIKIGFLTAFTGLETILGQTQWLCYQLAANQINAHGGIAGRKIQTYREDDGTNSTQTIDKSKKLALQDKVTAVVGLISSLEREAALTVLPKLKTPLFYTTYYEGAYLGAHACSPYYVGLGQVPNQQIDPLVPWLSKNVGKSYYIIGSDYIWPRGTSVRLKQLVQQAGGSITGEKYTPFGTTDFSAVFNDLQSTKPDICWVTLAGGDFATFLSQYKQFGAKPKLVSIGMDDVFATQNPAAAEGVIASQDYFMSIKDPANVKFLKAYQNAYGPTTPANAIAVSAYVGLWLIKEAIEHANGSLDPKKWLPALSKVTFDSPMGKVRVNATNQGLASTNYIGEVQKNGTTKIITKTPLVQPIVQNCKVN